MLTPYTADWNDMGGRTKNRMNLDRKESGFYHEIEICGP